MTATEMMLAELIALRCSVAAIAGEMLLQNGADAFFRAEGKAIASVTSEKELQSVPSAVRDRSLRIVRDIFRHGDTSIG